MDQLEGMREKIVIDLWYGSGLRTLNDSRCFLTSLFYGYISYIFISFHSISDLFCA